jgi:hypothetical protein
MKFKERVTVFTFPVFRGYTVNIIFTNDVTAARAKRNDCLGISDFGYDVEAMHGTDGQGTSILFFQEAASAETIAHESWHAVHALMRWVGASLEDEIVAYHLSYIVDQVVKFQNRGHNDRRRKHKAAGKRRNRGH